MRTVVLALLLACGVAAAAPASATFALTGDHITATITGGPRVPLADITLDSDRGKRVDATAVTDEPIAIALVIQGTEVMMGNDDMMSDEDPSRNLGYLKTLRTGLPLLKMPSGSQLVAITYADQASVRVPLGLFSALPDSPLGTQKDYYGKLGSELVSGVELALGELRAAKPARKVLVVIGDGNDTNNEAAGKKLADIAKRAASLGIRVESLIYKSALSSDGDIVGKLGVRPQTIASVDGIPPALTAIVARASDRYTATFPLIPGAKSVTLRVGGERIDSFALAPPEPPGPSAWVQLGMGLVFIAGLTLFLRYGTA